MRISEADYRLLMSKGRATITANPRAIAAANSCAETQNSSKFRNRKVEYDGHVFDSWKECRRYKTLLIMQRANLITDLKLQVAFELEPPVVLNGKKKKAVNYIAELPTLLILL